MLIPNKFNGYRADGCRLLPAGGGVGEAALLNAALGGAALGGGAAALTDGDPLKGALLGGLTGGAFGALGGVGAGGAAAGTAGATTAAGTAGTEAALASMVEPAGITSLNAANTVAANSSLYPAGATAANTPTIFTPAGKAYAIPSMGSNVAAGAGAGAGTQAGFLESPLAYIKANPVPMAAAGIAGAVGSRQEEDVPSTTYNGPLSRFKYNPDFYRPQFAEGGITNLPVERMSDRNEAMTLMADGGQMYAKGGGISDLGSYSDGGRMLKGPGDGMSDSIPATIANKRPARLATDEFVVPADVVSHLGNGSSDAGARQLYAMMDRVRSARTGTKKQGRQINPKKMMPA